MKESKRNLKVLSYVILALAVYSLIRVIISVFTLDFDPNNLPEGATAGILLGGQIFVCVVSFILLLPQTFVGIKGIKVSNNPDSSKAHIVWAVILAVLSGIGAVSSVATIVSNSGDFVGTLHEVADMVIDVCMYIAYVKYAKQVRAAA